MGNISPLQRLVNTVQNLGSLGTHPWMIEGQQPWFSPDAIDAVIKERPRSERFQYAGGIECCPMSIINCSQTINPSLPSQVSWPALPLVHAQTVQYNLKSLSGLPYPSSDLPRAVVYTSTHHPVRCMIRELTSHTSTMCRERQVHQSPKLAFWSTSLLRSPLLGIDVRGYREQTNPSEGRPISPTTGLSLSLLVVIHSPQHSRSLTTPPALSNCLSAFLPGSIATALDMTQYPGRGPPRVRNDKDEWHRPRSRPVPMALKGNMKDVGSRNISPPATRPTM